MAQFTINTLTVVTHAVSGTPQAIVCAATPAASITFSGDGANTGNVYVFQSGLALADGIPIVPNGSYTFQLVNDEASHDRDTLDINSILLEYPLKIW